ncbi:MAG: winged helix-turn-helix transcriptional regulator [Candidatus Bathyarchaeota archaeon]|nr:winged helix-turn-helix transcriptional regulator [Candidatus Bathyarchaeota archaeon]
MKDIERKMLSELVKNSRRSDRELAKAIGTSQPTATRVRTKLEKEGYIKEYTAIPNLSRIGYTIMAFTFLKLNTAFSQSPQQLETFRKLHFDSISKDVHAILLVKHGMGLGYDAVVLSLHSDYSSCDSFRNLLKESMKENIIDLSTFLVNLEDESGSLPLTFSMFANQLLNIKS